MVCTCPWLLPCSWAIRPFHLASRCAFCTRVRPHHHITPPKSFAAALAPILGHTLQHVRCLWESICLRNPVAVNRACGVSQIPSSCGGQPFAPMGLVAGNGETVAEIGVVASATEALFRTAGGDGRSSAQLAQTQDSILACAWRISALDASMPHTAWQLSQMEVDNSSFAAPAVRQCLRDVEGQIFDLERQIATSKFPSAAGFSSRTATPLVPEVDSRGYVFRIDDITYEQPGMGVRGHHHRRPISAVNEVDDERFPDIVYLHASVGGEGVVLDCDPEFLTGCTCTGGGCSARVGCACCREQSLQTGGAAYDAKGLLKATPGMPIYECNSACACPGDCLNRIVQRGISKRLQVFKTKYKGWAVRALERIPTGAFVCEYTGEVISTDEAERRGLQYDKAGFSTLFDLDAAGTDCEYTIDATDKCGVARFLNHSCDPNLHQFSVWVDTVSLALPRIAFFALRDVEPMEVCLRKRCRGGCANNRPCCCCIAIPLTMLPPDIPAGIDF